ncbi:MAG: RDD family protein [Gammaproteobacteria bacterium]|nr:RDD family protein [Gammaproteobacteria bacterium]
MTEQNLEMKTVGLFKRFSCMFYDGILLIPVLFFTAVLVVVPTNMNSEHPYYFLFIAYVYAVSFVFFAWCWTHGGQTLGLKTWRLRLVTFEGEPVNWKQAGLRFIGSCLCWLSAGIGFVWCYTNKERHAWNDLLSKTYIRHD